MTIVKATLIKQKSDDGRLTVSRPIGTEYLVDLDTIADTNPGFYDYPRIHMGERLTVLTVCPHCRGHYIGLFAIELLKIEAQA